MKKKLIIFGSSEISEIANFYFSNFSSYEISCFVIDEEFIKENYFCEKPILPFKNIEKKFLPSEYDFHVALSYKQLNRLKETKFLEVKKKGYKCANFISPSNHINLNNVSFGENCFILENQSIQNNAKIGNNVMIWSSNHIGHQTTIGDHSYISSHVVISGHCQIGERCFFGVNSSVADFSVIGNDCFIGMGANVNKDMKDNSTALNRSTNYFDDDNPVIKKIKKKYFDLS